MIDLLFFLILGHFCGDFALQSDRMAALKRTSLDALTIHVTLYTVTIASFLAIGLFLQNSLDLLFNLATVGVLVFIFVEHWLQDWLKAKRFNESRQAYYLDQAIHALILFAVRIFVYNG